MAENLRLHTESKDGSPTTRSVWRLPIRKDKDNVIGKNHAKTFFKTIFLIITLSGYPLGTAQI